MPRPSLRIRGLGLRGWIYQRGCSYLLALLVSLLIHLLKAVSGAVRKERAKQNLTNTNEPPPILASEGSVCRLIDRIEEPCVPVIEVRMLRPCDVCFWVIEASDAVGDWAGSGFCV